MPSSRDWGLARSVWLIAVAAGATLAALAAVFLAPSLLGSQAPVAALDPPRFVEEAQTAGIDHAYQGEWTFFVGGGVAVLDCNEDEKPDLYLAGGSEPATLYRNDGPPGGPLEFARVPDPVTDLNAVLGAYPLDVDGDGLTDLAVLRLGENVVMRGLGDCRFERANETWGIDGGEEWTAAFSATWEDNAALPTLAFGNYLALDEANGRIGTCSDNNLIRPDETGTGYAAPLPLSPGWCTLSILFSDWDRSNSPDLRMTNDKHYYRDGEEQLWRITQGEAPRLYTRAEGWKKMQIWGMGIATHDLTGDGLPEVFLTSQGDNKLQALTEGPAQPRYADIAIRRGVTAHRPFTGNQIYPSTAWHPEFQDVNNDGFIDLFISKGNVEAMPEYADEDPNNLLLGQPDGTFVESAQQAGMLSLGRTRGAALADFNLDGMLDLVEVNRRENVKLWRNIGWGTADGTEPMGAWLALRLEQTGPNRDAIGSWIEVKIGDFILSREVTVGGGHAGGQLGWIHFGLGTSDRADVRVQWPDGETGPWLKVEADGFWTISRDAPDAQRWEPPQD